MGDRYFAGVGDQKKEQEPDVNLPDELKGKSTQEAYDLMKSEHERILEAERNQYKAQLYELQQKQEEEAKKATSQQPQGYQQSQQQQGSYQYGYGYGASGQAEEEPDIYTDPNGFVEKQFQKRVGPLANYTFNALKETNKSNFQSKIGQEEWQKYGQEVEQFVDALAPEMQANPKAYETAYNFARSQHVDEIANELASKQSQSQLRAVLENLGYSEEQVSSAIAAANGEQAPSQGQGQAQQPKSLFQQDTGTVPRSQAPPSRPATGKSGKKVKLTPQQRAIAERFEMTEEEYAQWANQNTDWYSTMQSTLVDNG